MYVSSLNNETIQLRGELFGLYYMQLTIYSLDLLNVNILDRAMPY